MRVGTEEAPQVADVRAPEALPYLIAFERWWDIVWEEQLARRGFDDVPRVRPPAVPPRCPTLANRKLCDSAPRH
jgi:hypothetical protein